MRAAWSGSMVTPCALAARGATRGAALLAAAAPPQRLAAHAAPRRRAAGAAPRRCRVRVSASKDARLVESRGAPPPSRACDPARRPLLQARGGHGTVGCVLTTRPRARAPTPTADVWTHAPLPAAAAAEAPDGKSVLFVFSEDEAKEAARADAAASADADDADGVPVAEFVAPPPTRRADSAPKTVRAPAWPRTAARA
jgi:hypothetical protein